MTNPSDSAIGLPQPPFEANGGASCCISVSYSHQRERAILPLDHRQSLWNLGRTDIRLYCGPCACRRHVAPRAAGALGSDSQLMLHFRTTIGPIAEQAIEWAATFPGDAMDVYPLPHVTGTVLLQHHELDRNAWSSEHCIPSTSSSMQAQE